jgi:hypothetical protein
MMTGRKPKLVVLHLILAPRIVASAMVVDHVGASGRPACCTSPSCVRDDRNCVLDRTEACEQVSLQVLRKHEEHMNALSSVLAILALLAFIGECPAENLNRKYGRSWSCKMISAELEDLYQACRNCEKGGQEFDQTSASGGSCVPKYSLRETGEPADLREKRIEREEIAATVTAREREMENERRRQRVRQWLDSDVSGRP